MTTKTTIDWLTFRCQNNAHVAFDLLLPAFGTCAEIVTFSAGSDPKDGWLRAAEIMCGRDIVLGRVDYEGASQKGWVRFILTGEGCAWVQDWGHIAKLGALLENADIRRLDVALTTYDGEINHEMVVAAHEAGEFQAGAGRPPVRRTIESSDPRAGKTVYVGKRECFKFFRAYEKGFEMLKDVRRGREDITHIGGDRVENIYRLEVELKAVDKVIPWDSVIDRDAVFAGAYPFCARMAGLAQGRVLKALPSFKPVVALDRALDNCRVSYGAILRTALEALDGDKLELINRVISERHSDALVRAGVLTCVHPL